MNGCVFIELTHNDEDALILINVANIVSFEPVIHTGQPRTMVHTLPRDTAYIVQEDIESIKRLIAEALVRIKGD